MASADVEAATALKVKGNKAFAEHDWPRAVDFYTQAIEKYDKDPSFWCNRAQVGLGRRQARDHLLIWIGQHQA
jgi:serine/threonine-protein phosphatase 5